MDNKTDTTEQPALDSIHHLAIVVTDVAASVRWYQENFACRVAYQDATWALLKFANTSLALVIPGQHPPHMGIVLDNAARFGTLTAHRDGSRSVYIADPDGNHLEILEQDSLQAD